MEFIELAPLKQKISRIALGTRDCGKDAAKQIDQARAFQTLDQAVDKGINVFVTAPAYAFGENEKLLGLYLKERGRRDRYVLSTKGGLRWEEGKPLKKGSAFRNATKEALIEDCENSLRRLQTDYIDLYALHWPDPLVPMEETASALEALFTSGKIRAIGVSNFTSELMQEMQKFVPVHATESLYNLLERKIDKEELPYCLEHRIAVISYRSICGGLLTGNMQRFEDPKFAPYRLVVEKLQEWAQTTLQISLGTLAVRWCLDRGISAAIWGAKTPRHLDLLETLWGWTLSQNDLEEIEALLAAYAPAENTLSFGSQPATRKTNTSAR